MTRTVVLGGLNHARTTQLLREFTDNNDLPIQQSTKYRRVPLTVGLKYYLADRGRSVGEFAYIPSKIAPYVGVGAGAMWYKFEQNGDFVDFAAGCAEKEAA